MYIKNKHLKSICLLASLLMLISGCKQVPMMPGLTAYKIDIQQGNAVTQEMVAKLQPGMTRSQVRFALGTPLLVDPFRADRWDYFYSYMQRGDVIEQRRLAVFFKDDKLDRIEGDVIAAKPGAEKSPDKALGENNPKGEPVKPVAADVNPDAAKLEVKPQSAKPASATAAPATSAATVPAATLTTSDGAAVGSSLSNAANTPSGQSAVAKPEVKSEAKSSEKTADKPAEKPGEERGFFGRMLEKIGL